ncbi:M16 family metallopeptidase [Candidatus Laterigemmans baculatus]|uniref:M16 family metallopeptidase n=1 Tax=Candidatus Laterigemmans baculatus TaxID=2770505 RepID=UPI0013D9D6ED|nr:pitrilysin family protein [Candidatus Laterigemmans baculatus]
MLFRETTLANGLRIVAEINPAGYTASFGYFVHTGARDETDEIAGVSHFLEHMVFKGTPRRSAADVNRELDELGGQSNAYTSEEQTVYYATVIPRYQDRIVELLTDLMRPSLRSEDFESERQVILEEIAKYDDQPPFGAFERSVEVYFGSHGLGRRILGTSETVSAISTDAMRAYFDSRYVPSEMVFAAAGNLDFDAVVEALERQTTDWPTGSPLPPRIPPFTAPTAHQPPGASPRFPGTRGSELRRETLPAPDAQQSYAVSLSSAPSLRDPDRYAMRLLATVLGDESGSRLFWELIDTGRAEVAAVWPQEFEDCGVLMSYLICHPDDLQSNLRLVDGVLERIAEGGVEEDELRQAINKTTAGLVLQSERPSSRMFAVGNAWQVRGTYTPLDEQLERYRSVTPDQIAELIQRYPLAPSTQILATPST